MGFEFLSPEIPIKIFLDFLIIQIFGECRDYGRKWKYFVPCCTNFIPFFYLQIQKLIWHSESSPLIRAAIQILMSVQIIQKPQHLVLGSKGRIKLNLSLIPRLGTHLTAPFCSDLLITVKRGVRPISSIEWNWLWGSRFKSATGPYSNNNRVRRMIYRYPRSYKNGT